ncbi:MAG: helix-turn-helix domain-containing protein [Bdellovibrionaceae bacterium]|nr:helix-turn-helix domain-containing protein [Pseudobdellovibrionaceae bacterium]
MKSSRNYNINKDDGKQFRPMLESDNCSLKIEWLDSLEAARLLRLSVGALRNMTSNGQIPFYKLGNRNRYRKDELESLLLSQRKGKLWASS